MNETLRLYLESVVRLSIGSNPSSMTDQELVGVVGLLPSQSVGYADWLEKTKFGEEEKESQELKEKEYVDNSLEHLRLLGLSTNGKRNS